MQATIGILAGMGPSSTGRFVDIVVDECRKQYGASNDGDFPQMVIVSQPAPFFHNRETDDAAVESATLSGLQKLEAAGVDFIAMACNSVHAYFPNLQQAICTPLLNMVDLALDSLPTNAHRIAIVTSRPLANGGLYQRTAIGRGFDVVEPDWQNCVDELQDMLRIECRADQLRNKWKQLFATLAERPPVDAVVIGCLDLSSTLQYADSPVPIVDAAQALARGVVTRWLECERQGIVERRFETNVGSFSISTDRSRLNLEAIHGFLTQSYWAEGISRDLVARSIEHSLCFGVYTENGKQVGFARLVTDYTTFAYLCDVYVLEEFRRLSLGKALVAEVENHPVLKRVRRALLATRDAHGLYAAYGFGSLAAPERFMEINRPGLYASLRSAHAPL